VTSGCFNSKVENASKAVSVAAFALFGYYLLVITQETIDRRRGAAHNHQLELLDFFIKAFPPPTFPQLCKDN
jgi:hypothetical protein